MASARLHRFFPLLAPVVALTADAVPHEHASFASAPAEPASDRDIDLLRTLSQAEGLLRVGHAERAVHLLAMAEGGPHALSLLRARAWALFTAAHYSEVTGLLNDAEGDDDELAFLRAAALGRLGRGEGIEGLRGLWWEAPEGVWGLGALRELAVLGQYEAAERRLILTHIDPVRFDATQAPPHTRLFATLAREAPRQGQLAAEARAALGAHFLRGEKFSSAAAALSAARTRAPTALRRVISLRLGEAERRRGNYSSAQRLFIEVAAGGRDRLSAAANAAAGQMAIEFRRYPDARRHFEAQLVHNPVGPARDEALWGLGFVAFRSGDFRAAQRFFDTLQQEAPYGPLSPRALYWSGRAREELGDVAGAAAMMLAVAHHFPLDYYAYRAEAWLASAILVDAERLVHPARGVGARGDAERRLRISHGISSPLAAGGPPAPIDARPDPKVTRARSLVGAGMHKRALSALRDLDPTALSPEDLVQLEQASLACGAPEMAERFRAARARRFPDAGISLTLAAAFPLPYRRLLSDQAERQRLDRALVAGLIRQESGFRADAVSAVGALGLMQLMPATARLLYKEEGRRAPSHHALLDPETNVRLGSRYLGRMLRAFDRRLEYALAAYNAGPGAVTRWRQARGDLPVDIFVEEIPYAETRRYVETVLANARAYGWLMRLEATPVHTQALLP